MTAIELSGVTKRYGTVTALRDLDLRVEAGEIYGFLGPNGAGKSTAINVLLDFVRPTAGTASVFGHDCQEDPLAVRRRIGVLPEGYDVYERLTGRQHIEFACESKGVRTDVDRHLERVGITEAAGRKAGDYSKGMKQRLILGMALVGDPDLLILDEPTTGLDPNGARKMRELIERERDRGATVFFSSHILGQVDAVCDRVGILKDGELVAEDTIDGLRDAVDAETTMEITVDSVEDDAVRRVRSLDGVTSVSADGTQLTIQCDDGTRARVLATLEDAGVGVADFSTREASLEDLFEEYTREAAA